MVGGTPQNITGRERILNTPRYRWFIKQSESGKLPLIRDIKIDESIKLDFEVPKSVTDKQSSKWITKHADEIVRGWEKKDDKSNRRSTKAPREK